MWKVNSVWRRKRLLSISKIGAKIQDRLEPSNKIWSNAKRTYSKPALPDWWSLRIDVFRPRRVINLYFLVFYPIFYSFYRSLDTFIISELKSNKNQTNCFFLPWSKQSEYIAWESLITLTIRFHLLFQLLLRNSIPQLINLVKMIEEDTHRWDSLEIGEIFETWCWGNSRFDLDHREEKEETTRYRK